ncbi:hypothetical protein Nepgr_030594 [Nepenthes gracilis]|uniref:Uncharacterized protein n=1 Tax=Nepenthes gracilis TaxID=150966 RepID=A0AAD3TGI2_NEPGR|nr:hypothetical protein Nepgr_030594 [Nepenthes gracilis]
MAISFSIEWFIHFCLMGLRSRSRLNLWTIFPVEIPSISAGVHTKTSTLCLKKLINWSCRDPASELPIYTHLSRLFGFKGMQSITSPDCACCNVVSSQWSRLSAG